MFEPLDLLMQQRREDLAREANMERLAREAGSDRRGTPIYYGALAALGRTLSLLGGQLEERYGEVCPELPKVAYE